MKHWATILDIVEQGITGDKEKCRQYAELWLEKLHSDGEARIAQHLQHVLEGKRGQIIHLASLEQAIFKAAETASDTLDSLLRQAIEQMDETQANRLMDKVHQIQVEAVRDLRGWKP